MVMGGAGLCEFELGDEDFPLDVAWGEVVMVVEPDFTEGYDFRMAWRGPRDRGRVRSRHLGGVVRMDAYAGVNLRVGSVGETDGTVDFGRAIAGSDGQDFRYSRCSRPVRESSVEIFGEAGVVEVTV